MKSVCVFCGSSRGARESYAKAAVALGEILATQGLTVVYGGSQVGIMGALADGALAKGGRVEGVIPEFLGSKEIAHSGLSEIEIVPSMHARKASMAARADAFIALPGGFGTLEELFEILTWAQLGLHRKPCALLNVDGFFDGLLVYLDHAAAERLLKPEHRALLLVDDDPSRLIDRLVAYRAPPEIEEWITPERT
jgi:uncharacterized protein (TIGR00730 family)